MTVRQRLNQARDEYLRHPARATLRAYLILKANTTRKWDARYCRYYSIPTAGVTDWVKAYLTRGYAAALVPTATTNGTHAPHSFHRDGRAGDLGLPVALIGTRRGLKRLQRFQRAEYTRRIELDHTELIGPINNLIVLGGQPTPLPEGNALENQHDNHVHGARA